LYCLRISRARIQLFSALVWDPEANRLLAAAQLNSLCASEQGDVVGNRKSETLNSYDPDALR
jgi:hypothetical protein